MMYIYSYCNKNKKYVIHTHTQISQHFNKVYLWIIGYFGWYKLYTNFIISQYFLEGVHDPYLIGKIINFLSGTVSNIISEN